MAKTPTLIHKFKDEYYWLSNFYASPIMYNGLLFATVEHAFQAAKNEDEAYQRDLAYYTATPGMAKSKGRQVDLRKDWEDVKIPIMRLLVNKKFKIPVLRKLLIATGDAELVEGNTWGDTFWGVCNGKGQNHLGKIQMSVRSDILKNQRLRERPR